MLTLIRPAATFSPVGSREELEQRAFELARTHRKKGGFDPGQASALHVNPDTVQMDRRYSVDLKTKKLVEAKS